VAAGRIADGAAAHDAAAVLQSEALVACVRGDLGLDVDPPIATGEVIDGSNVVIVRVASFDPVVVAVRSGEEVAGDQPTEGEVIGLTVADVANSYARALVDVRGEQLRAGFGGAIAEIERRIDLVDDELAALDAEIAGTAARDDAAVARLDRVRSAAWDRRAALIGRLDDSAIGGASTTGDLQLVRRAVVPEGPQDDRAWWSAAGVGAIGGLIGVVVVALARAAERSRGRWERGDRALAASGLSRAVTAE
jgi:hypothetical protein